MGTDSGEGEIRGGRSGRARSEREMGSEQGKEEERGRREGGGVRERERGEVPSRWVLIVKGARK